MQKFRKSANSQILGEIQCFLPIDHIVFLNHFVLFMLVFNDSKVKSETYEYKHTLVTFIYVFRNFWAPFAAKNQEKCQKLYCFKIKYKLNQRIDLVESFPTVQTIQKKNTVWKRYSTLKFLLNRERCKNSATWQLQRMPHALYR